MNRSKIVAIITGVISILLAIAYLIVVQILDYRDMKPAPIGYIHSSPAITITSVNVQLINKSQV
ncbi:MAG: glucose-inhibited division protein A [Nostocales cyanobacterium]|nr:MAG: glucose-inhibited division protein A [Nostocales cyanobacterium]TAF17072.1 MAG: glucose-inhibited division protein A [Nostocales cyanobacterium]